MSIAAICSISYGRVTRVKSPLESQRTIWSYDRDTYDGPKFPKEIDKMPEKFRKSIRHISETWQREHCEYSVDEIEKKLLAACAKAIKQECCFGQQLFFNSTQSVGCEISGDSKTLNVQFPNRNLYRIPRLNDQGKEEFADPAYLIDETGEIREIYHGSIFVTKENCDRLPEFLKKEDRSQLLTEWGLTPTTPKNRYDRTNQYLSCLKYSPNPDVNKHNPLSDCNRSQPAGSGKKTEAVR
jgi:hypothetical protein